MLRDELILDTDTKCIVTVVNSCDMMTLALCNSCIINSLFVVIQFDYRTAQIQMSSDYSVLFLFAMKLFINNFNS